MSLPSLPPEHLPQLIVIQQPSPSLPAKGPPRSFWGGWGLLGWMLALSVGVSLLGSLSFAVAVSWGFWSMSSAVSGAIAEDSALRSERLKSARQFAKNRLADYGITELAKESHCDWMAPRCICPAWLSTAPAVSTLFDPLAGGDL